MDAVRAASVTCLSGVRVCAFYFILRYHVKNLLFFFHFCCWLRCSGCVSYCRKSAVSPRRDAVTRRGGILKTPLPTSFQELFFFYFCLISFILILF